MVSIREVKRLCKEETDRGITGDAVEELAKRIDLLSRGLIRVAVLEAGKKSERARVTDAHIRLAYLTFIDPKDSEVVVEENEEEWGEWNEDAVRDD